MQKSEDKKPRGKHIMSEPADVPTSVPQAEAAPPDEPAQDDVLRADTDLYGDESDVPLTRVVRKKRNKKRKKRAQSQKKKKKRSTPGELPFLSRFRQPEGEGSFRKRRTLFEIVNASSERSVFKPLRLFGREIRFWPLIVLAVVVILIAMVFLNNSNVRVAEQQITIVGLSEDLEGYRLLVISDLNGKRFGDKQSALLRTINSISYNAVICLGDMVGSDGDPEPFYELLEGLPKSKPVYFICGDSDPGPFVETPRSITGTLSQLVLEDWILGAIERGATYVDSPVSLTVGSSKIWLTPATLMNLEASDLMELWKDQTEQEQEGVLSGLQADYDTLPITNYRYRIAQNLYNSLSVMKESDFYLTLSHQVPSDDFILSAASHASSTDKYLDAPELLLAGHYCGGVWRLPLFGAFYVPDSMMARNGWFPNQEDVSGLSSVGETQIYITGGLSTNADVPLMRFRLLNQPEISVLTLTATLPESMLSAE